MTSPESVDTVESVEGMGAAVAPAIDSDRLPPDTERERIYRRNFVFFVSDFVLFSIGLNLLGPTTVIPDFVRRLTDSEILIGMSSQLFDIGWLLPQLLIARSLVRVSHKKWWFVGPNIPVRVLILTLSGIIVLLGPDRRSLILLFFLLFYALAAIGDGVVGVPWLDLAGSSLDNKRRAWMFGLGTASVGVVMLGLAPLVRYILGDHGPDFPNNYALLFAVAGLLFMITIPITMFIHELPGGKAQPKIPSLREYLPGLGRVLRDDAPYRAMITARVLTGLFTMAYPFYIGFATDQLGMSSSVAVSNLLLMQTLGNVAGALIFSWLGDRRTLHFIRLALVIGILQPTMALLASAVGPAPIYFAFAAAGVVQGTMVISFLNWVINYATPDQRPIYSGLFNSVSAVSLLVAPLIGGLIVQTLGYEAVFVTALVIIMGALYVATQHIKAPRPAAIVPSPDVER